MQCNFVVDSNGAGAIPRMDKNAAIIGCGSLLIKTDILYTIRYFSGGGVSWFFRLSSEPLNINPQMINSDLVSRPPATIHAH